MRLWGFAAVVSVVACMLPNAASANALADLYRLAAQNDLTLQTAAYQRDATVEARPRARAPLLPQLIVDGYYRANRRSGTSTNVDDAGTTFTVRLPRGEMQPVSN